MSDTITVRGFAATKPDLRNLPDGTPVASFRLASTPRRFDPETNGWVDVGPTNWFTVSCFRKMAGNVASSVNVGDAVLVLGRLRLRPWTTGEGEQRLSVEIDASALGPDLALGSANYRRSGGSRMHDGVGGQGSVHDTEHQEEHEGQRDGLPLGSRIDPLTGEVLNDSDLPVDDEAGDDDTDDDTPSPGAAQEESQWEGNAAELLGGAGTPQRSAAHA